MNDFSNYSDKEAYRIARLIAGFIRGNLSKTEHTELDNWVAANDENMQLFERLTDEKNLAKVSAWMDSIETEKELEKKKKNIVFNKPVNAISRFLPYAAAASVVIIVSIFLIKPKQEKENPVTATVHEILPGTDKATLTLADGKTILLDSVANGIVTTQGNTNIKKSDGQLEYTGNGNAGEMAYNSISIPKGGRFKLALSDGTLVWLNAASSIQYPVTFADNERTVSITGEVYFEVKKNAAKPFKVKVNNSTIEVLGTHFNVNAYPDEPVLRTTLAEGRIKFVNGTTSVILNPGQEIQLNENGEIKTVTAKLEETLAWKDGLFSFEDEPIEAIMREVERWYDAKIVYKERPTDHFNVEISRDVPVSKLLRILELTNRIHFSISDNVITVSK